MRFLRAVFGVGEQHRMFQADVLRWKCFTPHPFWLGGRGFALRYKGEIAAFGCLVPIRFLTGSGIVTSCNVIDWAASKAVPGAGLTLYRHIQSLTGTMINIGGTEDARNVLPKMGFQARTEIRHYARVVRPWHHFRNAAHRDWKSPLRLARDYRELSRRPPVALAARRIESFTGVPESVFPDPSVARRVVCLRTPESFAYFLACPAARVEPYLLERARKPVGYFLLSRVHHECRVADLWIRSPEPADWAAAYAAATEAATKDPNTTAVTAAASVPPPVWRQTHSEPVFVLDPDSCLGSHQDIAVGLLENDAFYWSPNPATPR